MGIHASALLGFFVPTQSCVRLHFMAYQGTAIWEPNSLPSCSRETGLKTSLMKGHVDTSHSSCLVGFGCRGEEEACISDLLPLASLPAMNLGVWFLWLGWFEFHMKLWQQALSSQEMLSHLFRGPGKPRLASLLGSQRH